MDYFTQHGWKLEEWESYTNLIQQEEKQAEQEEENLPF